MKSITAAWKGHGQEMGAGAGKSRGRRGRVVQGLMHTLTIGVVLIVAITNVLLVACSLIPADRKTTRS